MKLYTSLLFLIHIASVSGSWEFGRDQGHGELLSKKRILGREQADNQFEQPIKGVGLPQDDGLEGRSVIDFFRDHVRGCICHSKFLVI